MGRKANATTFRRLKPSKLPHSFFVLLFVPIPLSLRYLYNCRASNSLHNTTPIRVLPDQRALLHTSYTYTPLSSLTGPLSDVQDAERVRG